MARILVAEDDAPLQRLLKSALKAAGHEVVVAPDAAEALELLDSVNPQLLITDYVMPGMDGLELVGAVRSREAYRSVPVILFTAVNLDAQMLPEVQSWNVHCVAKGYPLKDLLHEVDELTR